ncbi:MAG: hypothetical protein U5O16_40855 [Rhodococcus sp. (in: high G+C Gram-positive bacteria)]|nr:hypothetical protein [Rhodococcus sp. (in: high G+C Gram-positive bacteria)]
MTEDESVKHRDVRDTIMNFPKTSRSALLIGALAFGGDSQWLLE